MTTKLFRAAEVCDMAQLQPYMLRSWEKEFPGIGLQKGTDGPRFYRQSDLDQVLRIKQLVFGEGLTLAGARRRLEETAPQAGRDADADLAEVLEALSSNAQHRIAHVKQGLQSILDLLDGRRTAVAMTEEYQLQPPPVAERQETAAVAARPSPAVAKKAKRATA
jgi:DNA-binding transcriptional MerR regulator